MNFRCESDILAVAFEESVVGKPLSNWSELSAETSISHERREVSPMHNDAILVLSECRLGGQRYELEETWTPDLGSPFGVMHCVHCECVPVSGA